MNIRYPLPARTNELRAGSREHTLHVAALRILQRELLQSAPRTIARLGASLVPGFEAFVTEAVGRGHPMDWTLHLEFGHFHGLDAACWREMCVGAVRRWVRLDLTGDTWMAVRIPEEPDAVVVGVRSLTMDTGPRVIHGRIADTVVTGVSTTSPTTSVATTATLAVGVPPVRFMPGVDRQIALRGTWQVYESRLRPQPTTAHAGSLLRY